NRRLGSCFVAGEEIGAWVRASSGSGEEIGACVRLLVGVAGFFTWVRRRLECFAWDAGRVTEINVSRLRRSCFGILNQQFTVDSLANLTSLVSFNAYGFLLPGPIPDWFGQRLNALQVLDLRSSLVTVSIPLSLGGLSTLRYLYLSGNNLTGSISSSLGNLSELLILDLSRNSLTGSCLLPPAAPASHSLAPALPFHSLPFITRIEARSEKCDMFMQLDVNTEIYPIDKEERFLVALSTTLSLEGGQKSLADKFEYIMHGKLYKISDEPEAKTLDGSSGPGVTVYVHMIFNHSFYASFFVFLLELLE
ncbi:putative lrr receptor-like serine/threonine-protein kinase, partial [Quercus suber]